MKSVTRWFQAVPDRFTSYSLSKALSELYKTQVLSSAGLAIKAGSSAIVKQGSAYAVVVNGVLVAIAANTDTAALTGANVATATSNIYLLAIDATGTTTWYPGVAGATVGAIALPTIPFNVAVVGGILVQNATGSNFVPGTTALDTGSLTVTYLNNVGPFFPVKSI